MAAGLPVASTAVGDIPSMVADENRPFLAPAGDEKALADAIAGLARDPASRARTGAANLARARAEYDEAAMIRAYARLYGEAIGRPQAFPHSL
jgi:glycosyltransferase involved in cell wall biosynthesis